MAPSTGVFYCNIRAASSTLSDRTGEFDGVLESHDQCEHNGVICLAAGVQEPFQVPRVPGFAYILLILILISLLCFIVHFRLGLNFGDAGGMKPL